MPISDAVREAVRARDRGHCQIYHREPVPASEIGHVHHQGMGGDTAISPVNQPSNLISLCAECHRKIHGPGVPHRIVRWEPDDAGGGLEVIDSEGRHVPHDALWFYWAKQWQQAEGLIVGLRDASTNLRELMWWMADALANLKASGGYNVGDYDDLYEFGHELGMSSAEVKRYVRAAEFAKKIGPAARIVGPETVDWLRRVPTEDLEEMLTLFADHPIPEAMKTLHDRYGGERMKTYHKLRAVDGRVEIEDVKAQTEDEVKMVPGEVVIRGGSVISGGTGS